MTKDSKLTYKKAGVDISYANKKIDAIKETISKTNRPEVISDIGGFGGFFSVNLNKYKSPVIVTSTDGVGTKLNIASIMGKHDSIGIDLVAMSVNDIIVSGAEPLLFMDYLSTSNLKKIEFEQIIEGIVEGCKISNCSLLGGETAEMPGMYKKSDYDLAGFVVGIVDRDNIIDGSTISDGDIILGLGSSGVHSNGYSLIRKIFFSKKPYNTDMKIPGTDLKLGEELLKPTKIYVPTILNILKTYPINGMAHITGGGIVENLPRILPKGTKAVINRNSWKIPAIFNFIQEKGNVPEDDMWKTFNMGIGMILVVNKNNSENIIEYLQGIGEPVCQIGYIKRVDDVEPEVVWEDK